jgi:hypothetical protein
MSKPVPPLPKNLELVLKVSQPKKAKPFLTRKTKRLVAILAPLLVVFLFFQLILYSTRDILYYPRVGPYPGGSILYKGDIADNLPNGQGKFFTRAGRLIAQGSFKDGKLHGSAIFYGEGGRIYEGQWQDGKRSGQGTLTVHGVKVYEGQWANDKLNGYGSLHTVNSTYQGEWKDNKREGQGVLAMRGQRYEGEFSDDLFHGQGTLFIDERKVYQGQWHRGLPHGEGTLFASNGDIIFSGHWDSGFIEDGDLLGLDPETWEFLNLHIYQRGLAADSTCLDFIRITQALLGEGLDQVLRLKAVIDSASDDPTFRELMYRLIELPQEPYEDQVIRECIRALENVPLPILRDIVAIGSSCKFFPGLIDVPGYVANPKYAGVYYIDKRYLVVSLGKGLPDIVTLHEVGHEVDIALLYYSSYKQFYSIWQAEAASAFTRDYYVENPGEYFAQFFANFYADEEVVAAGIDYGYFQYRRKELKEVAPRTYEFFEQYVDGYQGRNYVHVLKPSTPDAASAHISLKLPQPIPPRDFLDRMVYGLRSLFRPPQTGGAP